MPHRRPPTPPPPADRLLTETQVSERTAPAMRTLRRRRAQDLDPPTVRIGRSVRYRESDVLRWIAAGCP